MQPVDFTTLSAALVELQAGWVPARLEQVYQRDRHTLSLALRTLNGRGWLTISWHPQAARLHLDDPPPRSPDTFTFSDQLRHQLQGLALVAIEPLADWERAVDLQFARRPNDAILWHLYVEIMGKYSNVMLVNDQGQVVTAAHQVSSQQSSVRSIQTGQPYSPPPAMPLPAPNLSESQDRWQERVSLVPGPVKRNLLKNYRGASPAVVEAIVARAGLDPSQSTDDLTPEDWQNLFISWQKWLHTLAEAKFQPGWTDQGYTVLGWDRVEAEDSVQALLRRYYRQCLTRQQVQQLYHQLSQRLAHLLKKLNQKAQGFRDRLQQSDQSETYRQQADLLMAHLHKWQPGLRQIKLPDFTTEELVTIPLDPEKSAVQNAQALYKKHQKLKRAQDAIRPLLDAALAEVSYLEQVEVALAQLQDGEDPADLSTLQDIREELIQQGYLPSDEYRSSSPPPSNNFHEYRSPSGYPILIGRNNRQNDELTFRQAADYDLWFHTQEIPGSHVLLRPEPGAEVTPADLQFAADLAAYYSRARQSDRVPVVYTSPKQVYRPKGAKPGMVIYKQETVVWGQPQRGATLPKITRAKDPNSRATTSPITARPAP